MHTGSIEEYKLPHELTPKGSGKIGPFQNFTLLKQLVKPWKIVTDTTAEHNSTYHTNDNMPP